MPCFDDALYRWEQEYFLAHCAGRALQTYLTPAQSAALDEDFREISSCLQVRPRCLVHRDFQSQNVMWHQEEAWLIDFQGLREGNPLYDVASLLFDPYVNLVSRERERLFEYYVRVSRLLHTTGLSVREEFHLAAAQRLMQALGAYGNLGLNLGKPRYLAFIVPALNNLHNALEALSGLATLKELVASLRERAAGEF